MLGPGGDRHKPMRVIYETTARIADVAGDGQLTYFASGPALWKITKPLEAAQIIYTHPNSFIHRLIYVPGAGIFYATDKSVGYAGDNAQFDFIRSGRCQIAATSNDLYVLLGRLSDGVLRISGLNRFSQVKL